MKASSDEVNVWQADAWTLSCGSHDGRRRIVVGRLQHRDPAGGPSNKSFNQSCELCSATSSRFRIGSTQEVIGNSDGVAL
ncbi:MAG: hypothetical protein WB999_17365 [Candidatus Binataceae bacterium]